MKTITPEAKRPTATSTRRNWASSLQRLLTTCNSFWWKAQLNIPSWSSEWCEHYTGPLRVNLVSSEQNTRYPLYPKRKVQNQMDSVLQQLLVVGKIQRYIFQLFLSSILSTLQHLYHCSSRRLSSTTECLYRRLDYIHCRQCRRY